MTHVIERDAGARLDDLLATRVLQSSWCERVWSVESLPDVLRRWLRRRGIGQWRAYAAARRLYFAALARDDGAERDLVLLVECTRAGRAFRVAAASLWRREPDACWTQVADCPPATVGHDASTHASSSAARIALAS